MQRILIPLLLCLALLALAAAGCSADKPTPAPDRTPPAEPSGEEDPGAPAPETPPEDPSPSVETRSPDEPGEERLPLPVLDGAWEPGYYGPRAEISGSELVRLWRAAPVLTTTFTLEAGEDGRCRLILQDNELRNSASEEAYATIRECWYEDGALTFVDDFPISGESVETLYPTTNNRYGNVTVVDEEMLPVLEGEWLCGDMDLILIFQGSTLRYGYTDLMTGETEITAVKHNSSGEIRIVDKDPSVDTVGMFGQLSWKDGVISTYIPITDVSPAEIFFRREDKP